MIRMNSNPSPVVVQRVQVFPFGPDNSVMDDNEFGVEEFEAGGFFGDDTMLPTRSHGVRSHLDDLASRHPEFADSLRGPPWASELRGGWGRGAAGDHDAASAASAASSSHMSDPEQADEPGPLRGRPRTTQPPPAASMRNTVPDMAQAQRLAEGEDGGRGQRSWSAPPDNRAVPKRFVSRLEVNPVPAPEDEASAADAPDSAASNAQSQENNPPPPQAPQQPPASKPAGNVRHIPIFVEGRDEPVVPKHLDSDTPSQHDSQHHFTSQAQHHFQPQQQGARPFPANQKRPFQTAQHANPPPPQQKQQNRSFNTSPKPFQSPNMQQQQQQQPQQQPQQQQQEENVTEPPKAPPAAPMDPISRVQAIQHEVSALKARVEAYAGSSRLDREYVLMDELLTRNLLKLDDVETEGREDIRNVRKAAIRSIQECIDTLEAKVPLPTPEAMQVALVSEADDVTQGMDTSCGEAPTSSAAADNS